MPSAGQKIRACQSACRGIAAESGHAPANMVCVRISPGKTRQQETETRETLTVPASISLALRFRHTSNNRLWHPHYPLAAQRASEVPCRRGERKPSALWRFPDTCGSGLEQEARVLRKKRHWFWVMVQARMIARSTRNGMETHVWPSARPSGRRHHLSGEDTSYEVANSCAG